MNVPPATIKPTRRSLLLLAVCIASSLPVLSQGDTTTALPAPDSSLYEPTLTLLGKSFGDSVVLRWGPATPGIWVAGNRGGYIIERLLIDSVMSDDRQPERLTPTPLMPWNKEEWIARASPDNLMAGVAVQMLHGKNVTVTADEAVDITTLYHASQDLASRHGFALYAADLDRTAADGLALRFVDRDVEPDEVYAYRIFLADDPGYGDIPADTGYAIVAVNPYRPPPPPPALQAIPLDGAVRLVWDDLESSTYSGYHVYRSDDGGGAYRQLTEVPIVNANFADTIADRELFYVDSTVENYREYHYQLRGLTPFAETTPPRTTTTYARDVTPPVVPDMQEVVKPGGTQIVLNWIANDTIGDLAGFLVHRSAKESGPYRQITPDLLPSTARSYTVEDGNEAEAYYLVVSFDTAGNYAHSRTILGEIVDTEPPAPPQGLAGIIDTNGTVRLHWNLGPEPDIYGYHVLFANDSTHEFTQLTGRPWLDTTFIDTIELNTLTENVYYRIVAVDIRKNHSHMSGIVELRRPDIVPPEQSVFSNLVATDSSIVLFWHPSTSTDLAEQILLRRDPGAAEPREIARFDRGVATYEDRDVVQKNLYEYLLVAEDETGLRSEPSPPVQGRPYDDGIRPGIADLRAEYDPDARTITLTWDYAPGSTEGKHWFVLYRGGLDEPIGQFKAVAADQRVYVDGDISGRPVYRYAVRVLSSTTESPLSDEVIVPLTR